MFDANKRKYPRANYPCRLTLWLGHGSNETIMANTSNIGLGGLCVYLNSEIPVGTKVDIQLNFPQPTTPFRCTGVVVRYEQENEKSYKIGIQFDPLGDVKQAFLEGKIAEIIAAEQKGKS